MEVVPQRLGQFADGCLTSAQDMADGWSGAQGALVVDTGAAGNVANGFAVAESHASLVDVADVAIGRLSSVLEQDMDALYQCAFDFSCTDESAATDFETELSFLGRMLAR